MAAESSDETGDHRECMRRVCKRCEAPPLLSRVALGECDTADFERMLGEVQEGVAGSRWRQFKDKFGATLCHYAALAGRVDWLERCREAGGDAWAPIIDAPAGPLRRPGDLNVPAVAGTRNTIAHYAAFGGSVAALRYLAEVLGLDFMRRRRTNGCGVATDAATYGHGDALRFLCDALGPSHLVAEAAADEALGLPHAACSGGSVACVALVLDAMGADAFRRARNKSGRPATFAAAHKGHVCVLEYLRKRIGNEVITWSDGRLGHTLLTAAASADRVCVFEFVRRHVGTRLLDADVGDWPIAHTAAHSSAVKVLQHVVTHSADGAAALGRSVTVCGLSQTPAHFAASGGSLGALQFIAAHVGVDDALRAVTSDGWTPALLAADAGHVGVLRYLHQVVGLGGSSLPDGSTISHLAAERGHIPVLQFVKEHMGPDAFTRARTNQGWTVAHSAVAAGQTAVLEWIAREGGAGLAELVSTIGDTPACVRAAASRGHLRTMGFVWKHAGATPFEARDAYGWAAPHHAAAHGHLPVIDFLAKECGTAGRDLLAMAVGHRSNDVAGAPFVAAQQGHLQVLRGLEAARVFPGGLASLRNGAGGGLAHTAASAGHVPILRWIATELRGGADVMQAVASRATSYVHAGASGGHIAVLEFAEEVSPGCIRKHALRLATEAATGRKSGVGVVEYVDSVCDGRHLPDFHSGIAEVRVAAARAGDMQLLRFLSRGGIAEA